MCKILAVTSAPNENLSKIIYPTWEEMSRTDKDGYGAAWDSNNGLGWIKSSYSRQLEIPSFCEGFSKASVMEGNGGPLIVHGRTSTNDVCLSNTHPFVDENFALIHNGVVESTKYKNSKGVTCDSELILKAFMYGGIEEVSAHIRGWYACAIIEKTHNKTILHVFRDKWTKLYVGTLDQAYIFGTTENLIENVGGEVIALLKAETYCRFVGNKVVHQQDFESKIATGLGEASRKALGYQHKYMSKKERKRARRYANESSYDFMKDMEDEGMNELDGLDGHRNHETNDINPEDRAFGDY